MPAPKKSPRPKPRPDNASKKSKRPKKRPFVDVSPSAEKHDQELVKPTNKMAKGGPVRGTGCARKQRFSGTY